jgi:hypothetical protein
MLEREFRGFGMVEQWHTEEFPVTASLDEKGTFARPPTYLKSWFHLGLRQKTDPLPSARVLRESELDQPTLDAYRALKGLPIREEVYGDHISEENSLPYLIQENRYEVRTIQASNGQGQSVYRVISQENVKCCSEKSDDPRLFHEIVLHVNDYGRVTKSVSIAYGKTVSNLEDAKDRFKQEETAIWYTEVNYRILWIVRTIFDFLNHAKR